MVKHLEQQHVIRAVQMCIFSALCAVSIPASSMAASNIQMGGTAKNLGITRTFAQLSVLAAGLGMPKFMALIGAKTALIIVLLFGVVGICLCTVATSPAILYSGMIIGATRNHMNTIGKTIISNICDPDELPAQFGTLTMVNALSYLVGPILAIIVNRTFGCIFTAGVLAALAAVCIALSIDGASAKVTGDQAEEGVRPRSSVRSLLPSCIATIACTSPLGVLLMALDIYLVKRFGLESDSIAAFGLAVSLCFAISQKALFPKLHRQLGSARLFLCSGAAAVLPMLCVDNIESLPMVGLSLACCGVLVGCCKSSADVLMVELTAPDKVLGNSMASNVQFSVNAIMPIASGYILDADFPLFRTAALICGAGAALGFAVLPQESGKTKAE